MAKITTTSNAALDLEPDGTGEKIEGNDTDLTLTSGGDIDLTATSDVNIPAQVGLTFGADTEKIEADASNNVTLSAAGDIILDADGADIKLKDGGVQFGTLKQASTHLVIQPESTKEIILNDQGGAAALTIDNDGDIQIANNIDTGIWNGSIIGSAYGGNLVKTGAQTWNGAETSKYVNACFSATYKSYLMNGALWNPEAGNPRVMLQFTTATDTAHTSGWHGVNMDGTEGSLNGSGATYAVLDASFTVGPGKTIVFSCVVKGTHDADMEPSMVGTLLSESNFYSGGIFNTAEGTTMVGLYLSLESDKDVEGWINVYGIQE